MTYRFHFNVHVIYPRGDSAELKWLGKIMKQGKWFCIRRRNCLNIAILLIPCLEYLPHNLFILFWPYFGTHEQILENVGMTYCIVRCKYLLSSQKYCQYSALLTYSLLFWPCRENHSNIRIDLIFLFWCSVNILPTICFLELANRMKWEISVFLTSVFAGEYYLTFRKCLKIRFSRKEKASLQPSLLFSLNVVK